MAHILIIEDEPDLLHTWAYYLEQGGHRVTGVMDGATANDMARNVNPDLVILDLHLVHNQENEPVRGMDILRELRTVSNVPVLIATGNFTDQLDRVLGFRLGADDYLIKGNFGVQELIARVEYQLPATAQPARHRTASRGTQPQHPGRGRLEAGPGSANRDPRRAANRPFAPGIQGAAVPDAQPAPQHDLCRHLAPLLGGFSADMASIRNNIRIQVSGIRRKLHDTRAANPLIVSIRGVGYCFRG